MKLFPNTSLIIKTSIQNGYLDFGAPDRTRTHNLRSRNPALYPVEATGAFKIL